MVILLTGIIASVAIPTFIDFGSEAREQVTLNRMGEIKTAITGDPKIVANGRYLKPGFEIQLGSLPNTLNDLVQQGSYANYDPLTKLGWSGPYVNTTVDSWMLDAWDTPLVYERANRRLVSCGSDKSCGNGDDLTINF